MTQTDTRPSVDPRLLERPVLPTEWLHPAGSEPSGDWARLPFGSSRMLPSAAYTSPLVFRWEQRHVFAAGWTCVGREDELRVGPDEPSGRPLTQRVVAVGDVSVVLTWPGDEVVALANTCRHRAHELLAEDDSATRQSLVCPYHAWSYDLAGRLRQAPGYHGMAGFEPADHGLVRLPVQRWHGWLFVHAASPLSDPVVADFDTYVGGLDEIVSPYAPEDLELGARHTYEVAANWKVITENYHECYHCPLIHPELCQVSPPESGHNHDLAGAWVGGCMDLRDGMETMSVTGRSDGRPLAGVSRTTVEYLGLWPNLLISAHPDYVMTHRMVPLTADRTWVECSWYVPRIGDGQSVDPSYAVEFWDITNRQDWKACESVQRGLSSPHASPGPFGPGEDAVHAFVQLVARCYQGQPVTRDHAGSAPTTAGAPSPGRLR